MINFVNPIYFMLSILIAGVILLYFFRKQYKEMISPTNLLWQQSMNEWQASPWLQKLQQNLLLWLQILALLLLLFALVRPFWETKGLKGEHIIFVVDPSATMSAMDQEITLLDKAKGQISELLSELQGQKITIILAGEKPEVVVNSEKDKATILKELRKLKVTYEHENMEAALRLANSFAGKGRTSLHVFSEGITKEDLTVIDSDPYIEVHNLVKSIDNLSLLSFGVAKEDGRLSALAVVENQSEISEELTFTVKHEEEQLFQKTFTVKAKEKKIIKIPDLPERSFFVADIKTKDSYGADNSLDAFLTDSNQDVFIAGEVNPFFIKALQTIGIKSTQLNEETQWKKLKNGIVFSEGKELTELPQQPLLIVNNNQAQQIKLKEPVKVKDDAILGFVELDKTFIDYAFKPIQGDWETIASSGDIPLIQKGRWKGQPIILLNFPLEASDWPLKPGFPIFLYNSYQWLNQQTGFLGYFQPGEEKWLNSDQGGNSWEIYSSAGESIDSIDTKVESFKAPAQPGVYQAVSGKAVSYFSVRLDEREKEFVKAASFTMNKKISKESALEKVENDKAWYWLALVALLVLMIEWEVYRRGNRI